MATNKLNMDSILAVTRANAVSAAIFARESLNSMLENLSMLGLADGLYSFTSGKKGVFEEEVRRRFQQAQTEKYQSKYMGKPVRFRLANAAEDLRESLKSEGLEDGKKYTVTNLWYIPAYIPGPDSHMSALERAVSTVKEPYVVLEVEVKGKKQMLGGYLFGISG